MAERKIEIQMATVGAAEAAAGVQQSTEAVKGLTKASDDAFEKMKAQVAEEAATAKARAEYHRERSNQAEAAANAQARELAATKEMQSEQLGVMKAEMFSQLGEKISQAGRALKEMGDEARDANPEFADLAETMGNGLETVGNMSRAAAMGFAMAGPAGAAAAAAFQLMIEKLGDVATAYLGVREAQRDWHASLDTLREAEAASANHHEEMVKRREAAGLIRLLNDQGEAVRTLKGDMDALGKTEALQHRLEEAKNKREDEASIAGGAPEDFVKINRTKSDAVADKAMIDARVERQRRLASETASQAIMAEEAARKAEITPGLENTVDARRKEADELREKAFALSRAYSRTEADSKIEKNIIDESAAGTIDRIGQRTYAEKTRLEKSSDERGEAAALAKENADMRRQREETNRVMKERAAAEKEHDKRIAEDARQRTRDLMILNSQLKNQRRGR